MSQKMINYLKENFRDTYFIYNDEIQNEIDILINNTECSTYSKIVNYYSINGLSNIFYIQSIPNLFRQCYINKDLLIPNICPSIVNNGDTEIYIPNLIDKKYIKSFLYYNFPSNSSNKYNINKLLSNIIFSNNYLKNKKLKETYGSFTNPQKLFNQIYSDNSMLVQLLNFNSFLYNSNIIYNNNLIGSNFKVLWDCTISCFCNNNNILIIGNINQDLEVTYSDAASLFNLYNNIYNQNILNSINAEYVNMGTNNTNINIYIILNYAFEVYQDIITQIQYYMENKMYCLKDYMLPENIPILFSFYNNFYDNQIKTNNKEVISSNISSVIPINTNLEYYVNSFISVYLETYSNNYLIKIVYLNNLYALIFFAPNGINSTNVTPSDYIYFFINVNNPSTINIKNNFSSTQYFNTVTSFVNYFIPYYSNKLGGAIPEQVSSYPNGGLFPDMGSDNGNSENISYSYYFYKNNILVGVAFLTLETDSSAPSGYGYGLALDYSDYNIIL
jgi:hypothetical protein